ncbi:MAG: YidC/Oxa1 family membrane protein insertase [Acholeplasmatales bacterium]|nr:YidC/Oxa1 family membrane protein insertase [Acholeplasmatales bacterium]
MKRFLRRNLGKIALISLVLIFVASLTSCRTNANDWYSKSYTTWGAEFNFKDSQNRFSFWQALWGWPVSLLSYPFAFLMHGIGSICGGSYFWGIVFTTLIVRTIAWPIYSKTNSLQVNMSIMQPEMQKIQAKYANRTDPESRQRMSQEMMKLYKKYHVNPLGCVFPMLIQFPIFMAMYECVRRIQASTVTYSANGVVQTTAPGVFALANTKLFGFFEINTSVLASNSVEVPRATEPKDIIFGIVIAVLFAGVTFLSQQLAKRKPKWQKNRVQVQTAEQEQQAKMMNIMNFVMIAMFMYFSLTSTALSIYWLIGGIYQLFQSYIGRKINEKKYYKLKEQSNIITNR